MKSLLVTAWCWAVVVVLTLVFGTLAIFTAWIPPRGSIYLLWARGWSRSILFLCGIRMRVEKTAGADEVGQAVFMANHESAIDIPVLLLAIRTEVRFLAKRSLFFVPLLGWSMWLAGFIPVDRQRADKARDVFGDLGERLRKGLSVLVFPEGTRSRDGRLGGFKKAGFLAAIKSGAPIVPIGLFGTREVLGASGLTVVPGELVVRIGSPIPTAGLGVSNRAVLMEEVEAEIRRLRGRDEELPAPRGASLAD